jgi:PAS domain S-box-containing protein
MPPTDPEYRTIFESAPDGILVVGRDGRILDANAEAVRLFGYEPDALVGMRVEQLVPEASRGRHAAHRDHFHAHARRRPMGVGTELEAVDAKGRLFPVEISLSPIEVGAETRVVATVRDITIRRRLRNFGIGALRAAEEERARIARELHDETAQELATHIVRLSVLQRSAFEHADELTELRDALRRTAEGVRRVARGLRPPELEDAGFEAALHAHVRQVSGVHDVEIEVEIQTSPDPLLDADELLALYRILQEAMSNAVRHADAGRIRVVIGVDADHVWAAVEDDGRGFDPASVGDDGVSGLGLVGMRERASMIGGRVSIDSGSAGTTVRVDLRSVARTGTEGD